MYTSSFAFIQNFGPTELIITLVVIVLLFGPKKLPDLSRAIGRSIGEFKKGRQELDAELKEAEKAVKEDEKEKETSKTGNLS
jgi:sec-independent protein translocase protein TatA